MISENGKVAIIEKYIRRETTADTHKNEMRFYNLVKLGRREEVLAALERRGFEKNVDKPLSDNPLQSLKYHLTVTAAMLARFCIEGGMDCNRAYELSDIYIRRADRAATQEEIMQTNRDMCLDYLRHMEQLRKDRIYSKPIVMSIDYIYSNLHRRITAAEVAASVNLNENYFSKLFKQETGIAVSRYILLRKIETAQNLLKHSDYSCAEIAELLAFSSQSHFISRFREECGVTPLVYRNQHFNHMELSVD
ncbi:MAG: AraC family transcriptional regulator [Ruminococcus sp.]|nr:AraC family transcriptional regulator [Ruminococcus sp.]